MERPQLQPFDPEAPPVDTPPCARPHRLGTALLVLTLAVVAADLFTQWCVTRPALLRVGEALERQEGRPDRERERAKELDALHQKALVDATLLGAQQRRNLEAVKALETRLKRLE